MNVKEVYVQRKWRQTVVPMFIADDLALGYIFYGLGNWAFGNSQLVHGDLFKFAEMVLGFSLPFFAFVWLVRVFIRSAISKQQ